MTDAAAGRSGCEAVTDRNTGRPIIYLDCAATALHRPPEVEQAVAEALRTLGNPGRGAHDPTLRAARLVYDTREKLARLFGIKDPMRIAFTANSTEALNTAIEGLFGPEDHIITTQCEHNSVLRPLYRKEAQGAGLTILHADAYGCLDYHELKRSICSRTKAVVVTHASNLTGNVTELGRISEMTRANGLLLVVDASQTAGAYPIDVERDGIDVLCFTGHKGLLGPQGTGGIYVSEKVRLRPLKVGGSGIHSYDKEHPAQMPEALEAGTLNAHGIAGLHAALDFIEQIGVEAIHRRELMLAERFVEKIRNLPDVRIYGTWLLGEERQHTAVVSINIGGEDSSRVSDLLWEEYGICVRAGAHCAPLLHEALGTVSQGAVRFSFSWFNTEEEVDTAAEAVREMACS